MDEIPSETTTLGNRPSDMLAVPPAERRLLQWLLRDGHATADEAAVQFGLDPAEAKTLLDTLVQRGFVECVSGDSRDIYHPRLGTTRKPGPPPEGLWGKLRGT